MRWNSIWRTMAAVVLVTTAALAGTFGKVVAIGGAASDLALDEARGVLYIANFTANRIEVMTLSNNSIQTSINVAPQPSALALSPDGRFLMVAHFGNFAAPSSPNNALTVIDLSSGGKQTFALGNPPLGVVFGIDGLAFVATTADFLLFDPVAGTTQVLASVAGLTAKTLPAVTGSFPSQITAASLAVSGDGTKVYGLTDKLEIAYDVTSKRVDLVGYVSSPAQGPRVVSVNRDGSNYAAGWALNDAQGNVISEFLSPSGALNIGSHAFDSSRGLIYAQIPDQALPATQQPILQIVDADNLNVRERLQLPENLAGRSVLSSDSSTLYSVSDSGVMVLPVGALGRAPRVVAAQEDMVFRGNFCDRRVSSQSLAIVDPGGGNTSFSITSSIKGITVTPSSGITPAVVRVTVDPGASQNQKGTLTATLQIRSAQAVNLPPSVRVLINSREPDQRGTFVNLPGKLVDLLADPGRDRFYILRQDTNQVLVFDGTNFTQIATLRTFNGPTQLAITFDRRNLLVGHNDSQFIAVFDLETLQASQPIRMPVGHYPRSVAASARAILVANRVAGVIHTIDRVDMNSRTATELPSLGVYKNNINANTVLVASANGSSILAAEADGNVLLYNANADTFTISRKDFPALSGAYASSIFDQFVIGSNLLNSSLVSVRQFETGTGTSSGFAFVDQTGFRTTVPTAAVSPTAATASPTPTPTPAATTSTPSPDAGIIQRMDMQIGDGGVSRATRMIEAPLLGNSGNAFTRTLAALYTRNSVVSLSVSGFTVLPWAYDSSVAPPKIDRVVNAGDLSPALAPGGLITVFGQQFSPVNLATKEIPLPTALGESCLTVNGLPVPILFVSPNQINAQLPLETAGNTTLILRTPGGVSDNFNLLIGTAAPSVFRVNVEGSLAGIPAIVRAKNGELVSPSNPIHRGDALTIYLTGLGQTVPAVPSGSPAPFSPLAVTLTPVTVSLSGMSLPVNYAGLTPGEIGVYQINALVPGSAPLGLTQTLKIDQGGISTSMTVRVIE